VIGGLFALGRESRAMRRLLHKSIAEDGHASYTGYVPNVSRHCTRSFRSLFPSVQLGTFTRYTEILLEGNHRSSEVGVAECTIEKSSM